MTPPETIQIHTEATHRGTQAHRPDACDAIARGLESEALTEDTFAPVPKPPSGGEEKEDEQGCAKSTTQFTSFFDEPTTLLDVSRHSLAGLRNPRGQRRSRRSLVALRVRVESSVERGNRCPSTSTGSEAKQHCSMCSLDFGELEDVVFGWNLMEH